jgi:lipoate-protein ligase A
MALDEVLTRHVTTPLLRVYRWAEECVSFGYFGAHAEVAARWPDRALVRRWTGGGEVPHGRDFTYTLIIPNGAPGTVLAVRESYRAIHTALAPLLPGTRLAERDAAENPACFARPVVADLVSGGRKVAGAAQRRGRFGLLHQGSVQGCVWPAELPRHFAQALAATVEPFSLPAAILAEGEKLAAEKYGTRAWLERR